MKWIKKKLTSWIIASADSSALNEITKALLRRYHELFAEEEVIFLSLPKNDQEERRRIIQAVLELER